MTIDFRQLRENMVEQQVRPWEVVDMRVLETLNAVPREAFVPDAYRGLAYADVEIPNSRGGLMLAPKLVGHLLQALNVQPGDKVLEIGTGMGYVTACLSQLGGRVISLEIDPDQASETRARIAALKIPRIEIREGDGLAGPVAGGPFDAIAVKGSLPTEDALPMLQGQLAIEGRLFCIIGEAPVMRCLLVTRLGTNTYRREWRFETHLAPLKNAPEPTGFVF